MFFSHRKFIFISFLLVWGLSAGICLSADDIVTVKADGYDSIINGNLSKAREGAIQSSFARALKDVVATIISDETIKHNHTILEERVYGKAQAFIRSYSVVKEKPVGNMFQLTIKADVASKRLKATLAEAGLYEQEADKPDVLIISAKQDIDTGELVLFVPENENDGTKYLFETLFSKYLKDAGFGVIELQGNDDWDAGLSAADDLLTNEAMQEMGKKYNAELVSFVRLLDNSSVYGGEGRDLGSAAVLITAKVVAVKNGELVFSDMSKGVNFGSEAEMAFKMAVKNAAMPLLEKMAEAMTENWNNRGESLSTVNVTITGLTSYTDFIKIKDIIQEKVSGVESIQPRGFSSGKAALDIVIKGDTHKLSNELTLVDYDDFIIDISDVGVDFISLHMRRN